MKKIFYLSCLLGLLPVACLHAQPGTVQLKDGAGLPISTHASVTEAYAAIPATLSQAYIMEMGAGYTGASETYPITFVAKTGASAANTITLRPAAGVSSVTIQSLQSGGTILSFNNADYVIVDGRPGGMGTTGVLTVSNTSTGSSNTVIFTGGANYNVLRYCELRHASTTSAGATVQIASTVSEPAGNSNNLIEFCKLPTGRYRIRSEGNTTNLNRNNRIYGCEFINPIFVGVWSFTGTGKLTVDSCSFYCNSATGDGVFGILVDNMTDTVIIRNNRIYDLQNATGTGIRGIHVRNIIASTPNYTDIYNNFISFGPGNATIVNMAGIELSDADLAMARVANNSVRMGGTVSGGGTSGNVVSSGLLISGAGAGSQYVLKNNLLVNARTGGNTDVQHVGMAITSTGGTYSLNNNTFNSATGNLARWGATAYTTLPAYQAAVPAGQEANSNAEPVQYVSGTDLHLAGASVGNPALLGEALAGIATDIDNEPRATAPYRGADEAVPVVPGCSGTPNAGNTSVSPAAVCAGGTVNLSLPGIPSWNTASFDYQWQSSTNGVTYTVLPNDTNEVLSATITQNTWFRCEVTCISSGLADTSAAVQAMVTPVPVVASISQTHNVGQYTFTATGVQNATSYAWNFGDGNTGTATSPTHTYTASGNYTVTLVVSNACGSDTATLAIYVGCEGTPSGGTATANPTVACPGQTVNLGLTGINALIAPTLTFQWQSSADGTVYGNIAGATAPTYSTTVTAATYFRCMVTCTASGLSANSAPITVNHTPLPTVASVTETHTGGSYSFTATGVQNATSYAWNFGNGNTSTATSPTYTYATGGPYTVTLVVSNACGSDTATLNINVGCTGAPAQAGLQVATPTVCEGEDIEISLTGLNPAEAVFYTYQWQGSANGGAFVDIAGATAPTLDIPAGSMTGFRCVVTCSGNSTPSQTATVAIQPLPTGGTIVSTGGGLDQTFSVTGLPAGTFTYAWNFGDGHGSADATPTHTYAFNATYVVEVIVTNACGSDTLTMPLVLSAGIDEAAAALGLGLYPNPTDDGFNLVSEHLQQVDEIRIVDAAGRVCGLRNTPQYLPAQLSAKAMNLVPGTYLVQVRKGDTVAVLRLVVR